MLGRKVQLCSWASVKWAIVNRPTTTIAGMTESKEEPRATANVDTNVVKAFGEEWTRFRNDSLNEIELVEIFNQYTAIFPWDELPENAVGFDAGCGSGRWARFFAPRVGLLHCVDASAAALDVAREVLADQCNVKFYVEDISCMSLADESCDFGYSLGVLHHIPDTERALGSCVAKLKPGAPLLIYVYYDPSSMGIMRSGLLKMVSGVRWLISRLPSRLKVIVTGFIACVVYFPLARLSRILARLGRDPSIIPLFQYRDRSFYVMRNDALDRFGTRLEKRYSREDVRQLMEGAGLDGVIFSENPPWWVAVGRRSIEGSPVGGGVPT